MVCNYCGFENQPGARFCVSCGEEFLGLPPDVPPDIAVSAAPVKSDRAIKTPAGRKRGFKSPLPKKTLFIAGAVIILIIALVIIIPQATGPGFSMRKDNISLFFGEDTIIISGNNNAKFTIGGEFSSVQRSLDGSKAAILTDVRGNLGGTLWFVTTSGSYIIAEDVVAYQLADSGNGVVYLTDYDSGSDIATMYLYDTAAKKQAKITDEAKYTGSSNMEGVCISPNGKTTSYISDYNAVDKEFSGYIKVAGRDAERIGKDMYAVAISDGGRHLYYVKVMRNGADASLYVRSGRNDIRLIPDMAGTSIMLNADYSQVVYEMDGRSYFCSNGGEKVKLGNSVVYGLILPRGSQSGGNSGHTTVYGIKDFAGNVIRNEDGLAYLDSRYEVSRIPSTAEHASRAFVSSDGKTLLYINNNGHLSSIDPTKPSSDRREIGRDIQQFNATGDCKTIYYINSANELWCVKGNRAPAKVADDVYKEYLVLPWKGNRAFFLVDYSTRRNCGELYCTDNGGKRVKIAGGEDVSRIWVTATSLFFRTIDNVVYRSGGGDKFAIFADDVK